MSNPQEMSRLHASTAVAWFALLAGCGEAPREAPAPQRAALGAVEPTPQRAGLPASGYDALVNKAYVTCGIPYPAYRRTAATVSADQRLPGRTGRNAELPYYLTSHVSQSGVELVVPNCLTCHAAHFDGKLIVGLGSESADFTRDAAAAAQAAGVHVTGERATAEWRKWSERIAAISPYVTTDTVGVNPAVNLTWALFAHRDPETLAWSAKPLLEPPPKKPLPVSVPPWWRMGKKNAMFYTAAGRGDHARLMILASTLCTDTVEEARAIDSYADDIRAYLAELAPPAYPFRVDAQRAARGRQVFERTCASCHGTYGPDSSYPNLVIGLDVVGTDPRLAAAATDGSEERFLEWLGKSFYGENATLRPAPGYYAPPLDAVWATAPYLHNGSIPTLEALLDSRKRPRYWTRSFDSRDYDARALGWHYSELAQGKEALPEDQRRRVYDTTLPGYSNQGHLFGDALSDEERLTLLEYLKTL